MNPRDIARAWKDPAFRASLTDEQRAALPPNPAGEIELSDEELDQVSGGAIEKTKDLYDFSCGPKLSTSCTPNLSLKLPCKPVCGKALDTHGPGSDGT